MKKTRLGVTVGALGAITYFAIFFSGYMVAILLAGYVLLFERSTWLRRTVVKAVVLLAIFSVATGFLNLIPETISFIDKIAMIFNRNFSITVLNQIVTVLVTAFGIVEKILFLSLGITALSQGTIVIPFIDSRVKKYMD